MSTRNLILFGANENARKVLNSSPVTDRILFIADNNTKLHGKLFGNTPVLPAEAITQAVYDQVRITSGAKEAIANQLLELGVPKEKISTSVWETSESASFFQSLKDHHKGQRAFILGNGPSLRIQDLDTLHANDEISFAFNKIFLAFNETKYRPSYYIIEDPLVAENNFQFINQLEGFPKLIPHRLSPWFPLSEDTHHFNFIWDIRFPSPPRFNPDPNEMYWGSTVVYNALQWAVYMGCDPIHLIGVDFNFIEPQKTEMDGKVMVSEGERNHFHPDYRPVGERWFAPNLNNQLISFQAAREAADSLGVRIINSTRGGKLEVFPRVPFESLF